MRLEAVRSKQEGSGAVRFGLREEHVRYEVQ
jgi:hypothetical protein